MSQELSNHEDSTKGIHYTSFVELLQGLNKLVHIKHFVYIDVPQKRLLETAHSEKVLGKNKSKEREEES